MQENQQEGQGKVEAVVQLINVLIQARNTMQSNDFVSAKVMVGVARQMLDDLYLDLDSHLKIEKDLRDLLSQSVDSSL
jgi:hypothetical protein